MAEASNAHEGVFHEVLAPLVWAASRLGAHFWMALNIAFVIQPLWAIIYFLCPPALLWVLHWLVGRFPAFLAWTIGVYLLMLAPLLWRFGVRWLRLPFVGRALTLPCLLVWMLLISGEIVRAVAMSIAINQALPACYETSSLRTSLQEWEGISNAHAWMIVDGKRHIWSYRGMRFVADARPLASGGTCGWKG